MFLLNYSFIRKFLAYFSFVFLWNNEKRRSFRNYLLNSYGCNNKIVILSNNGQKEFDYLLKKGLTIIFKGCNNTVVLDETNVYQNCHIYMNTSGSKISFGKKSRYTNTDFYLHHGDNMDIELGNKLISNGFVINMLEDGCRFSVGDDCLFSNSISIWCSDGHSIYEKGTKNRINFIENSVKIGNHCWIGEGVKLTKNAQIPDNTIVGMGAIVTSSFSETHTIIAGNPAKVIKKDVDWTEEI